MEWEGPEGRKHEKLGVGSGGSGGRRSEEGLTASLSSSVYKCTHLFSARMCRSSPWGMGERLAVGRLRFFLGRAFCLFEVQTEQADLFQLHM